MNTVYLISKQDNCPENNNGDHIIEAWTDLKKAEERVAILDKQCAWGYHIILQHGLNCTEDEFYREKYKD